MIGFDDTSLLLRKMAKKYPVIDRAEGSYLYDESGKAYLDASGGAMLASIGHGRKEIARAAQEQLEKVAYVNGTQFATRSTNELADKLTKYSKPLGLDRVTFDCSGSEAVEMAIKFAKQVAFEKGEHKRTHLISRNPSYHGNTFLTMSLSARPHYSKPFKGLTHEVSMVEAPYEYRSPVDYQTEGATYYAGKLDEAIQKAGPENVLAFVVEPVSGSSVGANVPPPGYFEAVQEICSKYGVMTIADEILCGAGRVGSFFASDAVGFKPDLLVLGKGLAGGYAPLSALFVREQDVQTIKDGSGDFMHAQTFMQVPSLSGIGLAVLNYLEEHDLVQKSKIQGQKLHQQLAKEIGDHPWVGHIAGMGLLAGVEFVEDRKSKKPFDRSKRLVEQIVSVALSEGLVLWPNVGHADGINGDLVMLGPPYTITDQEIDELCAKLKKTLGHCQKKM